MSENIIYEKPMVLGYQNVDFTGHFRLAEIFRELSALATEHAEMIHVWDPSMMGEYGWIVSKMRLIVSRPPIFEQSLTMKTWPGKGSRVIFPRYYVVCDDKGVCVEGIGQWTMLDLKQRRIVMPSRVGITFPEQMADPLELKIETDFALRDDYEFVEKRQVRYEDIDTNGHLNNARYIAWITDCLELTYFESGYIGDLSIYFKKEVSPMQVVTIMKKEDGERFYFLGTVEDDVCFVVEGQWRKY